MSFSRLVVSAPRRALQLRHSLQHPFRQYSIFQEFSKKLKGEIDKNPELKESIKELKEKAEGLKSRTKETAEHLYKHVDAARGQAETRAKQVSSVIKEKFSEASEQVRETVASVNPKNDTAKEAAVNNDELQQGTSSVQEEAAAGRSPKQEQPAEAAADARAPGPEEKPEPNAEPKAEQPKAETKAETGSQSKEGEQAQQRPASGAGSFTGKVYQSLRIGKIAEVAKEGYNLLAEELTSTRKVKTKPAIRRSSVTDVVLVAKSSTGWRKHLDDLKEKASSLPIIKRLQSVKEHPVVQKSQEIVEEMREAIETSDSPVVHKIQNLNDSIFGETATAAANKEIRNRDPTFSLPDFAMEVQESVRPVLTAYLKGDFDALRKRCSKEVVERCRAEHRALKSQGMHIDNKILYISDVEVKESKLLGNEPVIIVSFQTQQSYCVRDDFGQIREGSKDDIRTVYYAWAMQYVPQEEMDPDDYTPRWQLREMQQLGVQAII